MKGSRATTLSIVDSLSIPSGLRLSYFVIVVAKQVERVQREPEQETEMDYKKIYMFALKLPVK
jgi:hypothetical protein